MRPITVRTAGRPVSGTVRPPGSKSITIRALASASLARGRSHIYGALVADDSRAMVSAMRALGAEIDDRGEPWSVDGQGGHLKHASAEIDAGESGLTARIVMAMAALADASTTITGRGRLLERPMDALVQTLESQGVSIQTSDGHLPVTVNGQGGLWGGAIEVDCSKSSQFATAILLCAPTMTRKATIRLNGLTGSAGYLDTTVAVMEAFGAMVSRNITGFEVEPTGYRASDFVVEPDASAAVYPMVAAAITGGEVEVEGLGLTSTQPDISIAGHLGKMGCDLKRRGGGLAVVGPSRLKGLEADLSEAPDGALALAVACAFADGDSHLTGLHSLQYKESDRLTALASELTRLGAGVEVTRDAITIRGGRRLNGAEIDPHGDHRIAMALAVAGLRIAGIRVSAPGVVDKTWPGFWEMLDGLSGA